MNSEEPLKPEVTPPADLVGVTIAAANEVDRVLGPGFPAAIYENALCVELERVVREELPEVSRVDVHLEPLEPDWVHGEEVTEQRSDLAARVRRVVERHPEVTACKDVELSSRGDRIIGHVVAQMRGDVTLEHAHAVETELQDRILAEVPDVYEVVARVTT